MTAPPDNAISLSEVVEQLREDLQQLASQADAKELQFEVGEVEVELHVAVTKELAVGAKAKFWVVEFGGDGKQAASHSQKIVLKLRPRVRSSSSRPRGAIMVSD